jgi:3-methyladenine DNA glycosylase AlkD
MIPDAVYWQQLPRNNPEPRMTAAAVRREVKAQADPARAAFLQRFFRAGPGEYAEGDRLLGLTVPQQRVIAKTFRDLPLAEAGKLLGSKFHEHRLVALLILVEQYKRADAAGRGRLRRFYREHLDGVNNCDLVDTSAAALADPAEFEELAVSSNVWHRRIAMVGTFSELRAGRVATTFRIAEMLLDDRHDLIHKATGWLLREAGKICEPELLDFLRRHYARLPRTALRYAIERLDAGARKAWLRGPQPGTTPE